MEWHEIHEIENLKAASLTERQQICLSVSLLLNDIAHEASMLLLLGLYGGDAPKVIEVYEGITSHSGIAEILDLTLDDEKLIGTIQLLMSMIATAEQVSEDCL